MVISKEDIKHLNCKHVIEIKLKFSLKICSFSNILLQLILISDKQNKLFYYKCLFYYKT